jgi:hypothetical protein
MQQGKLRLVSDSGHALAATLFEPESQPGSAILRWARAFLIAGELQGNKELASAAFNARVIPSVAYTDPDVAWAGLTEGQAKTQGIKVKKRPFPLGGVWPRHRQRPG